MILLPFPVSFLRWCLWRFQLWAGLDGGGSPRLEFAALDRAVQALFVQGLSPRTVSSYRSGIRQYVAFCLHLHLHSLNLSDLTLCHFVSSLYTQCLSHSSLRSYLSSPVPPNPCRGPRHGSGCVPPVALRCVSGGPSVPSVQSPCSAPSHSRHFTIPPVGSLVCLSSLLY